MDSFLPILGKVFGYWLSCLRRVAATQSKPLSHTHSWVANERWTKRANTSVARTSERQRQAESRPDIATILAASVPAGNIPLELKISVIEKMAAAQRAKLANSETKRSGKVLSSTFRSRGRAGARISMI